MNKPYSKTPIALRIADYAKHRRPKPKTGMEEEYRLIRNRLRKYSASSIVACALHLLWHEPKDPMEAVGSMPWLTLLIVKWALQDGCVSLRIGPPMPLAEMDRIRQQL